jgi:hypothetical protein
MALVDLMIGGLRSLSVDGLASADELGDGGAGANRAEDERHDTDQLGDRGRGRDGRMDAHDQIGCWTSMRFESSLNVYSWGSAPRRVHPACIMILNSDPDALNRRGWGHAFHFQDFTQQFPNRSPFWGFCQSAKIKPGRAAPAVLNFRSAIVYAS